MADNGVAGAWDVIVIGAGPVGENAADRARKAGLSVAVVEQHLVGGECSFYACSPSKALLRPDPRDQGVPAGPGVGGRTPRPAGGARPARRLDQQDPSDTGAVGWLDHVGIDAPAGRPAVSPASDAWRSAERTVRGPARGDPSAPGTAPLVPTCPGCAARPVDQPGGHHGHGRPRAAGRPRRRGRRLRAGPGVRRARLAVTIIEQDDRTARPARGVRRRRPWRRACARTASTSGSGRRPPSVSRARDPR